MLRDNGPGLDLLVSWIRVAAADPALTLRVYAHAMREEETDLSFAEFGVADGSGRLYPSPSSDGESPGMSKLPESMARREGFEPPTLRFEASFALVPA